MTRYCLSFAMPKTGRTCSKRLSANLKSGRKQTTAPGKTSDSNKPETVVQHIGAAFQCLTEQTNRTAVLCTEHSLCACSAKYTPKKPGSANTVVGFWCRELIKPLRYVDTVILTHLVRGKTCMQNGHVPCTLNLKNMASFHLGGQATYSLT